MKKILFSLLFLVLFVPAVFAEETTANISTTTTQRPTTGPTTTQLPTTEPTTPLPSVEQVKNLTIEGSYDKITLSWQHPNGTGEWLNGYQVYRSEKKNGTYTMLGDDGGGQLDCLVVDKSVDYGVTYYYKVRGYFTYYNENNVPKTIFGSYSPIVSATVKMKNAEVTATSLDGRTIRVNWNKVEGASAYDVYRADEKNGDYKLLKRTKNLTLKNSYYAGKTRLVPGATYYYKVMPVLTKKSTDYFSDSNIFAIYPRLSAVKVTKLQLATDTTASLKWKKNNLAVGYKIYLTRDNEKPRQIKTLLGKNKTSYTLTKLKNGSLYKVRIYAYVKRDGKIYKSQIPSDTELSMNYYAYANETYEQKSIRVYGDIYGKRMYSSQSAAEKDMVEIRFMAWDIKPDGKKYAREIGMQVNKKLAPTIKKIMDEIYQGPEKFPIHTWGSYNWRGNGSSSEHCLGTAIDLNWTENYMIDNGKILAGSYWKPGEDPYSIKPEGDVVRIMEKYGFHWGIDWNGGTRRDYMHFSYFGT